MALLCIPLFVLFFNARISVALERYLFDQDLSSFCDGDRCTVEFANGTSISLPQAEFHSFMAASTRHKRDIGNEDDLDLNPKPEERNNKSKSLYANGTIDTFSSPVNEKNTTELTSSNNTCKDCDRINSSQSLPASHFQDANITNFNSNSGNGRDVNHSQSIPKVPLFHCRVRLEDGTIQLKSTSDSGECVWNDETNETDIRPDRKQSTDTYGNIIVADKYATDGLDNVITPSYDSSATPSTKQTVTEMDYDYNDQVFDFQEEEPTVSLSKEEIEEAEKMTECAKKKTEYGIVCVCNATYCDKFIPPERTPKGVYTWYTSSNEGLRFRKLRNNLEPYKTDEEGYGLLQHTFTTPHTNSETIPTSHRGKWNYFFGVFYRAFYINTSKKYQEIIGFGGAFSDSSCTLIKALSSKTRKQLLESYFGPFGINYRLGRVPIAGTDFSHGFYTYLDFEYDSMANFMLTEHDFKYKIPIILEAIKLTRNRLKLIGSAWSPPLWMKTSGEPHYGTLKREYWPAWAEYHIKFLDQYQKSGVTFWALTVGNEPMNYYYITFVPFINALEWTPYEQSQWVSYHLYPMLKNSTHRDVLLLGLDENREFITFFMKYFYEDYQLRSFVDPTYSHESRVVDAVSGIAIHGYMDHKSNLPYLQKTKDLHPDKFLIYTETCCFGVPKLGSWTCAEFYATGIIEVLNHWVTGWVDWNIALDFTGGPNYVNNPLNSPIIVDVKRDEFLKEPTFYIMSHFSIFLLPDSYRVETVAPKGEKDIDAVAVHRPDDGKVIVFYNKNKSDRRVTFLVDKKYKLSLEVPGKSMNSVLFW